MNNSEKKFMLCIPIDKIKESGLLHLLPSKDCIEVYNNANSESLVRINNENFINKISTIFNPQLLNSLNNSNTYVATFSKEGLALLESGQAVLRPDKSGETLATLFDAKSGKIIENARLENMLNPVSLTFSIWSVLSIITAQYYLHKVNYKLENIQKDLNYIKLLLEVSIHSSIENEIIEAKTMLLDMEKFDDLYALMKKYNLNSIKNSLKNNNSNINSLSVMINNKIRDISIKNNYFERSSEVLYLLRTMRVLIFIQNLYLFLLQYIDNSSSEIEIWAEKVNSYTLSNLIENFEKQINKVSNKDILGFFKNASFKIALDDVNNMLKKLNINIDNIDDKINKKFKPEDSKDIDALKAIKKLEKYQLELGKQYKPISDFRKRQNLEIIQPLNIIKQDLKIQEKVLLLTDLCDNNCKEVKIVFSLNKNKRIDMDNLFIEI